MIDELQCERCDEFVAEPTCLHGRILCPDCEWVCYRCESHHPNATAYRSPA